MIKRLGFLALVAGALAACNENTTGPATPASFSAAGRVTTPLSAPELPTLACPSTSPADQISAVLARVNGSKLSAAVKAQITQALQNALAELSNRDLTTAAGAVQAAIGTLQASNAPQPVKDAVSALLNCVASRVAA